MVADGLFLHVVDQYDYLILFAVDIVNIAVGMGPQILQTLIDDFPEAILLMRGVEGEAYKQLKKQNSCDFKMWKNLKIGTVAFTKVTGGSESAGGG